MAAARRSTRQADSVPPTNSILNPYDGRQSGISNALQLIIREVDKRYSRVDSQEEKAALLLEALNPQNSPYEFYTDKANDRTVIYVKLDTNPAFDPDYQAFEGIFVTKGLIDKLREGNSFMKDGQWRKWFIAAARYLSTRYPVQWRQTPQGNLIYVVTMLLHILVANYTPPPALTPEQARAASAAIETVNRTLSNPDGEAENDDDDDDDIKQAPVSVKEEEKGADEKNETVTDVSETPKHTRPPAATPKHTRQQAESPSFSPFFRRASSVGRLSGSPLVDFLSPVKVPSSVKREEKQDDGDIQQPVKMPPLQDPDNSPAWSQIVRNLQDADEMLKTVTGLLAVRRLRPHMALSPSIVWARDLEALDLAIKAVMPANHAPAVLNEMPEEARQELADAQSDLLSPVTQMFIDVLREITRAETLFEWLHLVPVEHLFVDIGADICDSAAGRTEPFFEVAFLQASRRLSMLAALVRGDVCVHNTAILQFDPHSATFPPRYQWRKLERALGLKDIVAELDALGWKTGYDNHTMADFEAQLESFETTVCNSNLPVCFALALAGDEASCSLIRAALSAGKQIEHPLDGFAALHRVLCDDDESAVRKLNPSLQALALVYAALSGEKGVDPRRILTSSAPRYTKTELDDFANQVRADDVMGPTRMRIAVVIDALLSGEMPPLPPFTVCGIKMRAWMRRAPPPQYLKSDAASKNLLDLLQVAALVAEHSADGSPQHSAYLSAFGVLDQPDSKQALCRRLFVASDKSHRELSLAEIGAAYVRRLRAERVRPSGVYTDRLWPSRKQRRFQGDAQIRALKQELLQAQEEAREAQARFRELFQTAERKRQLLFGVPGMTETRLVADHEAQQIAVGMFESQAAWGSNTVSTILNDALHLRQQTGTMRSILSKLRVLQDDRVQFTAPVLVCDVDIIIKTTPKWALPAEKTDVRFWFVSSVSKELEDVPAPFALYLTKVFDKPFFAPRADKKRRCECPIVFHSGEPVSLQDQADAGCIAVNLPDDASAPMATPSKRNTNASAHTQIWKQLQEAGLAWLLLAPYASYVAPALTARQEGEGDNRVYATKCATRIAQHIAFLRSGLCAAFV